MNGKEQWESGTVAKALAKNPERRASFETSSGIPVERLYTPEESMAYLEDLRQVPQTARPQIDQTAENGADSKIV